MTFDDKHRKVYIGDQNGLVRVFNVNTGTEITQLQPANSKLKSLGEYGRKCNKEVCNLSYMPQDDDGFFLVAGHWNSRIRCWDVTEPGGEVALRTGSQLDELKEDIMTIAVSQYHSLIATGGTFGTILLWDFELFKVEGVLIGNKMGITSLNFVDKYPLLISTGQCGTVCVYAVRGAPKSIKNMCLARFVNISFDQFGDRNIGITSSTFEIVENEHYDEKVEVSEFGLTLRILKMRH